MSSRGAQIALVSLLFAVFSLASASASRGQAVGVAGASGRIAYASSTNEEVWTVNATGSERVALIPGSQPLIAPDGTMVAILPQESSVDTYGGPALALDSTVGAMPIEIGEAPAERMYPEAFSPDSRYLAVAVESSNAQGRPLASASGVGVLETETGTFTMLAHGLIAGASFNPSGGDELVYASANSVGVHALSNLYVWAPGSTAPRQITTDGRSLDPIWGPSYIAYAHERPRRGTDPEMQVWLRTTSGVARQLTHVPVNSLQGGLVPVAFSKSGTTLVANLEGEDFGEPWVVNVPSRRARPVRVEHDELVSAVGISSDGSRLLLIASPGVTSPRKVLTEPVSGGRPTVIATHADAASWTE
jgi:hypothetical protein